MIYWSRERRFPNPWDTSHYEPLRFALPMSKGGARFPRSNGHKLLIDYAGINRSDSLGPNAGSP